LFDGRNALAPQILNACGFEYVGIGRGQNTTRRSP
jgi:hypothetical protein